MQQDGRSKIDKSVARRLSQPGPGGHHRRQADYARLYGVFTEEISAAEVKQMWA